MVEFLIDPEEIEQYLNTQLTIVGTYTIQPDHTVDVVGSVEVNAFAIYQLKVKFGTVTGNVNLSRIHLTILEGFPHTVGGDVTVARTPIKSLQGARTRVEGHFWAYHCKYLKTLAGLPAYVGKNFVAYKCKIKTLMGAPEHVGQMFDVTDNPLVSYDPLPQGSSQLSLPYNEHVGLFKLLSYPRVHLSQDGVTCDLDKVKSANHIIQKYVGQGKSAILNCALELKQAGLEGNAKW